MLRLEFRDDCEVFEVDTTDELEDGTVEPRGVSGKDCARAARAGREIGIGGGALGRRRRTIAFGRQSKRRFTFPFRRTTGGGKRGRCWVLIHSGDSRAVLST